MINEHKAEISARVVTYNRSPSLAGYVFDNKYVGDVTRISMKPVRALTNPLEKHVFPAPKSPSSVSTSPPSVPIESTAPVDVVVVLLLLASVVFKFVRRSASINTRRRSPVC